MNEAMDPLDDYLAVEPTVSPEGSPRWGWRSITLTLLAWLVILGLITLIFVRGEEVKNARFAPRHGDQLRLVFLQTQARYLLGASEHTGVENSRELVEKLNTGPILQRLGYVILVGELDGPNEALARLQDLDKTIAAAEFELTEEQVQLRGILGRLYRDHAALRFDAPSVTEDERRELREALGWFAELAFTPPSISREDLAASVGAAITFLLEPTGNPGQEERAEVLAPATRTFWGLILALGGFCFLGLSGLLGLVVFLLLLLRGFIRSAIQCLPTRGSVYAETFALWILLFVGLSWLGAQLSEAATTLLLGGAASLLSLSALAWPVLRGVAWRQVREDVGLTAGRHPAAEPFWGIAWYCMTLPLLAVALVFTAALLLLQREEAAAENNFAPIDGPSHPVVEILVRGDALTLLQVMVLACIVAPVVEEIVFRGVLYRHLRELSCRLGTSLSFLVSAVVVSVMFAIIHPQELMGVPVLATLAFGFTAAREWRGTLVPSMVAHGLSNGVVLTLFAVMAS